MKTKVQRNIRLLTRVTSSWFTYMTSSTRLCFKESNSTAIAGLCQELANLRLEAAANENRVQGVEITEVNPSSYTVNRHVLRRTSQSCIDIPARQLSLIGAAALARRARNICTGIDEPADAAIIRFYSVLWKTWQSAV